MVMWGGSTTSCTDVFFPKTTVEEAPGQDWIFGQLVHVELGGSAASQ
jgi:hypothetical protein